MVLCEAMIARRLRWQDDGTVAGNRDRQLAPVRMQFGIAHDAPLGEHVGVEQNALDTGFQIQLNDSTGTHEHDASAARRPRRVVTAPRQAALAAAGQVEKHHVPRVRLAERDPLATAAHEDDGLAVGREPRAEIHVRMIRELFRAAVWQCQQV